MDEINRHTQDGVSCRMLFVDVVLVDETRKDISSKVKGGEKLWSLKYLKSVEQSQNVWNVILVKLRKDEYIVQVNGQENILVYIFTI